MITDRSVELWDSLKRCWWTVLTCLWRCLIIWSWQPQYCLRSHKLWRNPKFKNFSVSFLMPVLHYWYTGTAKMTLAPTFTDFVELIDVLLSQRKYCILLSNLMGIVGDGQNLITVHCCFSKLSVTFQHKKWSSK